MSFRGLFLGDIIEVLVDWELRRLPLSRRSMSFDNWRYVMCDETLGVGFQWCGWYVCPTVNCLLTLRMCVGFRPNVRCTR